MYGWKCSWHAKYHRSFEAWSFRYSSRLILEQPWVKVFQLIETLMINLIASGVSCALYAGRKEWCTKSTSILIKVSLSAHKQCGRLKMQWSQPFKVRGRSFRLQAYSNQDDWDRKQLWESFINWAADILRRLFSSYKNVPDFSGTNAQTLTLAWSK